MPGVFRRAWLGYNALLIARPVLVPAITTGVLMGAGDLMAQSIARQRHRFDGSSPAAVQQPMNWWRTARLFGLGCCLYGPWITQWFKFLATRLQHRPLGVLKMVAADQLLMAPCFIGSYLTIVTYLNTGDTAQVAAQLTYYPDVLLNNYKLWPAVQTVNFLFVPLHLRILLANCVALVWNTYLSWVTHKCHDDE